MYEGKVEHEWGMASWTAAILHNGFNGVAHAVAQSQSKTHIPARPTVFPYELNPLRIAEDRRQAAKQVIEEASIEQLAALFADHD